MVALFGNELSITKMLPGQLESFSHALKHDPCTGALAPKSSRFVLPMLRSTIWIGVARWLKGNGENYGRLVVKVDSAWEDLPSTGGGQSPTSPSIITPRGEEQKGTSSGIK